jgi:uncharacterized iron-regulated membrane protein
MRKWHRRAMTVFITTLSYWVVSGLLMATYDATDTTQVWAREGGGPGARLTDFAATAAAIPDPRELAAGIAAARAAAGAMAIASIDLRMVGDRPRLQFATASGERAAIQRFDAASGAPLSERAAEGDPDAAPPANLVRRNALKSWHKGNALGLPGQFIGLFTGLGLIALVVTGLLTYLGLWRARRRARRPALFWSGRESRWRRLHRWVALVAALFVLNIAVTGVILAAAEIKLNVFLWHHIGSPPYPRPGPMPPVSAAALAGEPDALLNTSYQAARQARPGAPIASIQVIARDGRPKGLVTFAGPQPQTLAFDAQSGMRSPDWLEQGVQRGNGYYSDWHQRLKRLHRGDIIGHFAGRYLDLMSGLALLYLVISAAVMYLQTRRPAPR